MTSDNRVTIKTIAQAVGVTHGTVSRALRDDPRVKPETMQLVKDTAFELGYRPSRLGRALKTKRTGTLAIIVSYIHDPYYSEVVQAVHDRLYPLKYSLIMAATEGDLERQTRVAEDFLEHSVDGAFVCCLPGMTPPFRSLGKKIPIVTINCDPLLNTACVVHQDREAMETSLTYLIQHGHHKIAYLGAENGGFAERVRRTAFQDTCRELSIKTWIHSCPDVKIEAAFATSKEWLSTISTDRPTAVVCFNDTIAIGLMKACRQLDITIPEDLSILGFDDIEIADYVYPELTTFSQPRYEMGRVATEMMMTLIAGGEVSQPRKFLGKLIERSTVGNVP